MTQDKSPQAPTAPQQAPASTAHRAPVSVPSRRRLRCVAPRPRAASPANRLHPRGCRHFAPTTSPGDAPSEAGLVRAWRSDVSTTTAPSILNAPEGEVRVGQYAAGPPHEGLAFFARKYEDLVVEIDLVRLVSVTAEPSRTRQLPSSSGSEPPWPSAPSSGMSRRLERKIADAESAREAAAVRQAEHRERMREQTKAAREALVTEAETLPSPPVGRPRPSATRRSSKNGKRYPDRIARSSSRCGSG
jgi:hypothetical protein